MKRAIFSICCLAAAIISFAASGAKSYAVAESSSAVTYARADAKDIYFCTEKDISTALFAIPYTYCVRILATEGDWYFVRYAEDVGLYRAVEGYCLKQNLTPVEDPPENIYLHMTVPLALSPYAPTNGSFPVSNILNVTAAFYGSYSMGGAEYSCVAYGDTFYYKLGVEEYPLNQIPVPAAPAAAKTKKSANAKVITALALTALAAAALIILYFTGRKRKFARTEN